MNEPVVERCLVTFEPSGLAVETARDRTLLDIIHEAGLPVYAGCGGRGSCGTCRVTVVSGEVVAKETHLVDEDDAAQGVVLACAARPAGPTLTVRLHGLPEKRLACDPGEELHGAVDAKDLKRCPFFQESLLATRIPLELPLPSLEDPVADWDRLVIGLSALPGAPTAFKPDMAALRDLGEALRADDGRMEAWVTGVESPPRVLRVGPRSSTAAVGAAVDLGTTSISLLLCDLASGKVLAAARVRNSQALYGADVITRILHASTPEGLSTLQSLVLGDINRLLASAVEQAGILAESITCVQCAGNTTMTQIALNINPTYIRKEPYVATTNVFPAVSAGELGLAAAPEAPVHFLPAAASYVGGDITAGVLATGFARKEDVSLFIDLGTNGEIVLGNADWLVCSACSVGPAFEGSGIRSGMLAERGAIDDVVLDGAEIAFRTIGGGTPRGICGSGLVRLFAELFRSGLIDRSGRFQADKDHGALRTTPYGKEFVLTASEFGEVLITQPDLDNLLRSKAAVYAAVSMLLSKMDLRPEDLSQILVAGGFGAHLDFKAAVTIGLLPDLPEETFRFVGNTALSGARHALLSRGAHEETGNLAGAMTYIELSGDNEYHEEFVRASFLPHTDLRLFPSA